MKKVHFFGLLAAVLVFTLSLVSSCKMFGCKSGSGKQVSAERPVKDFSKIKLSGAYKLIIKQDSVESLKLTADDNMINEIRTDISHGELSVKFKGGNFCNPGPMSIELAVRSLSAISASGAVEISSQGLINTGDLTLDLAGSSKINLELNTRVLRTKGSGSTEIALKGQASESYVELNGSGTLKAFDFVVGKYQIETAGASHCEINVLNELNVRTAGSGDVEYRGNPKTIKNSQTGAASLKKVE